MAIKIPPIVRIQEALDTPFEPLRNPGFGGVPSTVTSEDTQNAIEELSVNLANSASPGLQFTASGTVVSSYLSVGSVPSNRTGSPVGLISAKITAIVISNETANTFTVKVEEHNGITYTSLGTFTVTAQRYNVFTGLNINITAGKELAVSVISGSCKNPVVNVYIRGNVA